MAWLVVLFGISRAATHVSDSPFGLIQAPLRPSVPPPTAVFLDPIGMTPAHR